MILVSNATDGTLNEFSYIKIYTFYWDWSVESKNLEFHFPLMKKLPFSLLTANMFYSNHPYIS